MLGDIQLALRVHYRTMLQLAFSHVYAQLYMLEQIEARAHRQGL